MTTPYPLRQFLLATSLLSVGVCFLASGNLVLAQTDIAPSSSPSVPSEATSTDPFTSPETTVTPAAARQPWFQIEKLNGDNLAVGDFVVGPGRAEIEAKPGETVVTYISVANRVSDNRTFEITVEDVAGSEDGDSAAVLLGDEVGPYTLKDYISFPEKTFTLNLGERARIPVTITIPKDAQPGGLYGSVLISTVRSDGGEVDGQMTRSPIVARIGTLFFVTVPGEVVRSGEVKSLSLLNNKWWYEKGPISLTVAYENTGSVHLNPYGELRIKNFFGEEVGFVELEPWFALPKSIRSRDITWDREFLLGRYVATVAINRGYDDVVDTRSVVFWVLPWKIVASVFLVIFILVFCLRFFFRTFEFKRKS